MNSIPSFFHSASLIPSYVSDISFLVLGIHSNGILLSRQTKLSLSTLKVNPDKALERQEGVWMSLSVCWKGILGTFK